LIRRHGRVPRRYFLKPKIKRVPRRKFARILQRVLRGAERSVGGVPRFSLIGERGKRWRERNCLLTFSRVTASQRLDEV
jgi:hypothetical protein